MGKLERFGLEEKAARVYYHLSRLGSSTASDLAEATGIHRTQVYNVVETLEQEGFVESTLERPRKFVPRPVKSTLDQVIKARRKRLDRLETTWEEVVDAWPRFEREDARQERFAVYHGRSQIKGALNRMIEDAEEEVLAVAHKRGLGRWDAMGILDELRVRSEEGVVVRAMTSIEEEGGALEGFAEWAELRHINLPGYAQFLVKDTDEIALFVTLDPVVSTQGKGETVLWLNAKDFILSQMGLFDMMWSTAVSYDDRIGELTDGPLAPRMEVVRGRWMRYDRMREMVFRAERSVRLSLPEADVARLDGSGVAEALVRAAERGVDVSVVASEEMVLEGVQVVVSDVVGALGMVTVDEEEVLVGMGVGLDAGSMTTQEEWAVWSSMPSFIEHVRGEFDVREGVGGVVGGEERVQSVE